MFSVVDQSDYYEGMSCNGRYKQPKWVTGWIEKQVDLKLVKSFYFIIRTLNTYQNYSNA